MEDGTVNLIIIAIVAGYMAIFGFLLSYKPNKNRELVEIGLIPEDVIGLEYGVDFTTVNWTERDHKRHTELNKAYSMMRPTIPRE